MCKGLNFLTVRSMIFCHDFDRNFLPLLKLPSKSNLEFHCLFGYLIKLTRQLFNKAHPLLCDRFLLCQNICELLLNVFVNYIITLGIFAQNDQSMFILYAKLSLNFNVWFLVWKSCEGGLQSIFNDEEMILNKSS